MKDQANYKSFKQFRCMLLAAGVIVGMVLVLYVLLDNELSLLRLIDVTSLSKQSTNIAVTQ